MVAKTITLFPSSVNEELTAKYPVIQDPSYPLTNIIGKGSTNDTYTQWRIPETSSAYSRVMYNFDTSEIPLNATINSIQCTVKAMISDTSSQVISKRGIDLRSLLSTGAYYVFGSATIPDAPTEITISCETLTRDKLDTLYLDFTTIRGKKTTSVYERIYGASLTITYTAPIIDTLFVKQSGKWKIVTNAYKKSDGVWIKQEDITSVYQPGQKLRYIKPIETPIGVNLYDKTAYGYMAGGLLNEQGGFGAWGPGSISNYIKVKNTQTFSVQGAASSWQRLAYYDGDYNLLEVVHSKQYTESSFSFGQNTVYQIPYNATFARVNVMKDEDVQIKRII